MTARGSDVRVHRPRELSGRPTVSVVIPCYDYGHYLPAAVASALDQRGLDLEVLVVDDASTDDSAEVAAALAAGDPRVRVLVHHTNQGHIATYNDGLGRVAGQYVVLLSADDVLSPDSLTRAVALMETHPGVGMVYGHAVAFHDQVPVVDAEPRSWTTWSGRTWLELTCRRSRNPVYTPSVVMRREAWADAGPYDARVSHAADMLMWFRTASAWDIGRVNNAAQAFYRVHGQNMHMTTYAGMLRDVEEQREVLRLLFEEQVADPPLRPGLRLDAQRALTRRAMRLAAAERRSTGDENAVAALLAVAASTRAELGGAGPTSARLWAGQRLERDGFELARRVEAHVAWRVWRRYGL